MARQSDLTPARQAALEALPCEPLPGAPFANAPPVRSGRVALLSTAGLMLRGERPVPAKDTRYRVIPHDAPAGDVLMGHVSVSFDRAGFVRDENVVLPRTRLNELSASAEIGSVAPRHLSFMGATAPADMVRHAKKAAVELLEDGVTHVIGLPV